MNRTEERGRAILEIFAEAQGISRRPFEKAGMIFKRERTPSPPSTRPPMTREETNAARSAARKVARAKDPEAVRAKERAARREWLSRDAVRRAARKAVA